RTRRDNHDREITGAPHILGDVHSARMVPPTRFGAFNSGDVYIEPGMRLNTSVPPVIPRRRPATFPGGLPFPGWEVHRIGPSSPLWSLIAVLFHLSMQRRPGLIGSARPCCSGSPAKQSAKFCEPGTVSPPERGTREVAAALLHLGQFE